MQKLLILLAVAVAACAAEQIEDLKDFQIEPSQLLKLITLPEIQAKFERILSLTFTNYLEGLEIGENIQPKIPVLPIYDDDESPLDSLHIHVANDSGISDWFYGDIHFCKVTIRGLRSIYNNLKIKLNDLPRSNLTFVYKTGEVTIDGLQDTFYNVDVNFLGNEIKSNLRASQEFIFKLTNFSLVMDMTIENIFTKFDVSYAEVTELKFDRLDMNFKNTIHNGEAQTDQDWVDFSATATVALNGLLDNLVRGVILKLFLQPVLHRLLDECRAWNFIVGDYSCIGRPSTDVEKLNVEKQNVETVKSFLMAEISNFVKMSDSEICPPEAFIDPEATTPEPTSSTTEGAGEGDGAEQLTKPMLLSLVMLCFLFKF